MKSQHRLIIGSTISMLGSWVALTAVLIEFQGRGGPSLVTVYLLFLTLAPALLARPILKRMQRRAVGRVWFFAEASQAVLALIMAILVTHTPALVILVSAAAVMQNIAASTLMSIVSKKVTEDAQDGVLTAISSGSSLALVLGPAVGGALVGWMGLQAVLVVQALCFILAMIVVPWQKTVAEDIGGSMSRRMAAYLPPQRLLASTEAKVLIVLWVAFAVYGVLFDSVEMPVLLDLQGLSSGEAGIYISFYGAGGLVVFVAATFFNWNTGILSVSVVLVAGTLLWLSDVRSASLIGFSFCGLGYALVNGAIRSRFNRLLRMTGNVSVADGWSWLFQVSLACSAAGFAMTTVFFYVGGTVAVLILLLLASCCTLIALSLFGDITTVMRRKGRSKPVDAP